MIEQTRGWLSELRGSLVRWHEESGNYLHPLEHGLLGTHSAVLIPWPVRDNPLEAVQFSPRPQPQRLLRGLRLINQKPGWVCIGPMQYTIVATWLLMPRNGRP